MRYLPRSGPVARRFFLLCVYIIQDIYYPGDVSDMFYIIQDILGSGWRGWGGVGGGSLTGEGGGYLDNFCHFRLEYFDCLPSKIVSYELFRCGKMISEAVRIFYLKKWIFAAGG